MRMSPCYKKQLSDHQKFVLEKLNIQRCCGDFCDITVVVQRMHFRAHKCILSAASKKLHTLITQMKTKSNGIPKKHSLQLDEELRMEEISPQGFKIILEFIYTGVLWIPSDCLNEVNTAAIFLEMEDVIKCCNKFLGTGDKINASESSSEESEDIDIDCGNENNTSTNPSLNNYSSSNKLSLLDTSFGGILNPTGNSGDVSASGSAHIGNNPDMFSNSGYSNTLIKKNIEESGLSLGNQQNCETYPDQDALSEISVQNEDEVMYQVATSASSSRNTGHQSNNYVQYNHYVPPIEQTFSPRPISKLMASHMTILPSMMQSQAFFQDQGQFSMDSQYYMSQTGQYYPSNYLQQESGKSSYNSDQGSSNYNYVSNSSSNENDRRTNNDNIIQNTMSVNSENYQQTNSSSGNMTNNLECNENNVVYGDINDLHIDRELDRIHSNSYSNQNMSSKGKVLNNLGTEKVKQRRSSNIKAESEHHMSESGSQRYISISPVSCQGASDHPFIEAISPYNPEGDMPVPADTKYLQVMPQLKEVFTFPPVANNPGMSFENDQSSQVLKSNFNGRPAARMPPKKAGYRGIESDYNRHFNLYSDQYGKDDHYNKDSQQFQTSKDYKDSNEQTGDLEDMMDVKQNSKPMKVLPASNVITKNQKSEYAHEQVLGKIPDQKVNYPVQLKPAENSLFSNDGKSNNASVRNDTRTDVMDNNHIQTKKMAAIQAAKAAHQMTCNANNAQVNTESNQRPSMSNASMSNIHSNTNSNAVAQHSKSDCNPTKPSVQYCNFVDVYQTDASSKNSAIQYQKMSLPLEPANLYSTQSESNINVNDNHKSSGGLTPTKNNNMADLVDSIEDYLRLIVNNPENSSPSKHNNGFQNLVTYNTTEAVPPHNVTMTQTYPNNNGNLNSFPPQDMEMQSTANSTEISNDPAITNNNSATSAVNSSVNNMNNVNYSVEDVRKTILNVLSQECFDEDSTLSGNCKDQSVKKPGDNLPLTTLLKMVPFDRHRTNEAIIPGISVSGNLTQYSDVSSSQDKLMDNQVPNTSRYTEEDEIVRHFEDIDSASDDGSDYNLVIDFDKQIHEEDADNGDFNTLSGTSSKGKTNTSGTISKDVKGKLAAKLKTVVVNSKNTDKDSTETGGLIMHCSEVEKECLEQEPVEKKGSSKRKRPPMKIPKYALTAEYREDSEARLVRVANGKPDETVIVKPLKKRIKLKLMMKKLQEDNIPITRKMLKRTLPKRKIKHVCQYCNREFWDKMKALKKHLNDHETGELHFCNICGMGYRRLEDLSRHRSTNHSLHVFQCKECGVNYDNVQLYRKHCVTEHQNDKPFYCTFQGCNFCTQRFNILEKHSLIHSKEKQFTCPHCSIPFAQPNGLRSHLVSCMNMQSYICHLCGKSFNRNQGLKEHLRHHAGVKNHVCSDCGASFTDGRNYKRHLRTHTNEYKFTCKHCDCKFNYSNVLKRHIMKKHPDKQTVEIGKKGARNKESILIKNYIQKPEDSKSSVVEEETVTIVP